MATTTARLETRISTDLRTLLQRAAEIQGRTVTDFVAESLWVSSRRVVDEATTLRLSVEDQARFVAALLNPPEPNDALKRAFEWRRRLEAKA